MKECTRCGYILPATTEYFYRSKDTKDTMKNVCKQCCYETHIKYYKYFYQKGKRNVSNQEIKKCSRCRYILPKTEKYFRFKKPNKYNKRYFDSVCKQCYYELNIKYTILNKEKVNTKQREYYWANRDYCREQQRKYNQKPEVKARKIVVRQEYSQKPEVKARKNAKIREQYKKDVKFKILALLRHRLYSALKSQGLKKTKTTIDLCGCSLQELKQHLEKQFQPGMTWENHGFYGWHIDHIKPCVSFDLSDLEQQKECFHYANLQPLWAKDNLEKRATQ